MHHRRGRCRGLGRVGGVVARLGGVLTRSLWCGCRLGGG